MRKILTALLFVTLMGMPVLGQSCPDKQLAGQQCSKQKMCDKSKCEKKGKCDKKKECDKSKCAKKSKCDKKRKCNKKSRCGKSKCEKRKRHRNRARCKKSSGNCSRYQGETWMTPAPKCKKKRC